MAIEEIKWIRSHGEVGNEAIQNIEKTLGVRLPFDFIKCSKTNNGGHPSLDLIDVEVRGQAVINRLLSFHSDKPSYILKVYEDLRNKIGETVIPFASDPFGNFFCFDYRNGKEEPHVVFWDHEYAYENSEQCFFPVGGSFTEMLSKLYTE